MFIEQGLKSENKFWSIVGSNNLASFLGQLPLLMHYFYETFVNGKTYPLCTEVISVFLNPSLVLDYDFLLCIYNALEFIFGHPIFAPSNCVLFCHNQEWKSRTVFHLWSNTINDIILLLFSGDFVNLNCSIYIW
jgi:hypothetical protein